MVEFGPQGRAGQPQTLFVRFSDPVVSLEQSGDAVSAARPEQAAKLPRIEITPPLPGRTYFQTPERLVYELASELQPATRYKVSLYPPSQPEDPALFAALSKTASAPAQSWEFETDRPHVESFGPDAAEEPRSRTAQVVIELTQRVAVARLQSFVRAQVMQAGKPGPALPVRVSLASPSDLRQANIYVRPSRDEAARWITVQPQTVWPAGATIRISLLPGWSSEEGPLPADTPWETELKTLPTLRFLSAGCSASQPCGQDPLVLRFTTELPFEETKKIQVIPKPEWLNISIGNSWSWRHGSGQHADEDDPSHTVEIEGAFLPGRRYRVRIPGELRDVHGQKLAATTEVTAVFVPRPFLALSNERGILRRSAAQTVGVTARHLQTVELRAQLLDDAQVLPLLVSSPTRKPAAAHDSDDSDDEPKLPAPRAQFVQRISLKPQGPTDWASIAVDLSRLTSGASGAVLVEVAAVELVAARPGLTLPPPVRGLYRLTDLGPILTASRPRSLLSVHRLADGAPVAAAQISRYLPGGSATLLGRTDAHGVLSLETQEDRDLTHQRALFVIESAAPPGGTRDRAYLAIPQDGRDRDDNSDGAQPALRRGERLLTQVVTERDAYRPGETVRCVGFSAIESPYSRSSLRRTPEGSQVALTLHDPRRQVVSQRRVKTTSEGKFFAELPLPAGAALGSYRLEAELLGGGSSTRVKVEDYRTPEYTVTAAVDREELLYPARPQIRVAASYFFGGDVALIRGSARQHCAPTTYRPPKLDSDWHTGAPLRDSSSTSEFIQFLPASPETDRRGRATFIAPETGPHNDPRRCTVSLSVADASQQNIGAETSYLVHPARYYLAVRPKKTLLYTGDTLTYAVRALSPEGARVAATGVRVQAQRHYHETLYRTVGKERIFDRIEPRSESVPGCTLALTESGADASCEIRDLRPGRYVLSLSGGADAATARNETTVYVAERSPLEKRFQPPPPPPRLALWLAQEQGQPGDVLDAQVSAPWPLSGVVIIARKGVREHIPFSITASGGGSVPLKLPIDDSWVPLVHLRVVGVRPPTRDTGRPQIESVQHSFRVDHSHRRLHVQVEAPRETGPGSQVPIRVRVRDSQEQPMTPGAVTRIALWAVDEAVLSLTNYEVPDLLPSFIPQSDMLVNSRDEYSALLQPYEPEPDDPWLLPHLSGITGYGHGAGGAVGDSFANGGMVVVPTARQRFETTPLFLGDVALGPDGEAQVLAQLPDNLTTFRITALASARLVDHDSPGRFGKGDTRLRVSQPFLLRAALPRLLRPSDVATVGAILTNRAGPAGQAEVRIEIVQDRQNPVVSLQSPARLTQPLAAGEVLRLPFRLAAQRAGTVEIELLATLTPPAAVGTVAGATAAPLVDRLRLPFTVEPPPARGERLALYGTLDDSQAVALPLALPAGIKRDEGGLSVRTNPSLLRDLDGAARSLIEYPYGCVEQTSSRLVPLAALGDIGPFLPPTAAGASQKPVESYVEAGIERLATMQTEGGGFAYWPGGRTPNVYASAYATWVLHRLSTSQAPMSAVTKAKLAELIKRSSDYLLQTFAPPGADGAAGLARLPAGHLDRVRAMMVAQVLAEQGRAPASLLDVLYERRGDAPVFARALLLSALAVSQPADPRIKSLTQELLATVAELPGSAHVSEGRLYALDSLFHSDARSDAMVLSALLRTQPNHPVVPKLTRGLLDRRRVSAWRNTQENAYALLALSAYGRAFEATEPQLAVNAWLGSDLLPGGSLRYSDRHDAPVELRLPMPALLRAQAGEAGPLLLQRAGRGRLYYRIELAYTPDRPESEQPVRSQGLSITRSLRSPRQAETRELVVGEPAAIDVVLHNAAPLSYVAVEVPLPAGLEVLQRSLGRGQASQMLSGHHSPHVTYEELRADRVLLFADSLPAGSHPHTIYVRPTTAGHYVLPSAQAEAMYEPEIYGRTTSGTVEVK